jgi:hypothetical protein
VLYDLEPNLNPAITMITTYGNLQTLLHAVVGFTFYPGYKSDKKTGSEYHPQGLGLICVMGQDKN